MLGPDLFQCINCLHCYSEEAFSNGRQSYCKDCESMTEEERLDLHYRMHDKPWCKRCSKAKLKGEK